MHISVTRIALEVRKKNTLAKFSCNNVKTELVSKVN